MLGLSDRDPSMIDTPKRSVRRPLLGFMSPKAGSVTIFGTTTAVLAVLVISAFMEQAYTPLVTTSYFSNAMPVGVDCIGDGAICEGSVQGSDGEVRVTKNTDPHYYWQLKVTCGFGGDQIGLRKDPAAGLVSDRQTCKFGAPATYWNVIVDYRP
jgi:hypothetical protein